VPGTFELGQLAAPITRKSGDLFDDWYEKLLTIPVAKFRPHLSPDLDLGDKAAQRRDHA
jgi:hypothetical protein